MTFHVKFNLISKSCLFALLLHLWNISEICKNGVCSTSERAPHICSLTGSCHGPWNSLVYLRPSLAFISYMEFSQLSPQGLALNFTSCYGFFWPNYTPHMRKFHIPTLSNRRNNSKQHSFSFFCLTSNNGIAGFFWISAFFSMVNTPIRHTGYLVCSTSQLTLCI